MARRYTSEASPIINYFIRNQILVAMVVVLIGWFLFEIRDLLLILFIAYILMAALKPLVELLQRRGIPHIVAVIVAYFATLLVIFSIIFPLVPFFVQQVQSLFVRFPAYLDEVGRLLRIDASSSQVRDFMTSQLQSITSDAFIVTRKVFGGFFSAVLVLVLSFYLLMAQESIKKGIADLFSEDFHKEILLILNQIDDKLGAWFRGQIVLSFTIGFFTYIALTLLGLDFALPLAILAGILEVVPTLGPILSAVPAVIVALSVSPAMALTVVGTYIIIQFLENHILVPKIMQRAVGLSPIVVIIGVAVGAKLMGVLGALLSIPFISMMVIVYRNIRRIYAEE